MFFLIEKDNTPELTTVPCRLFQLCRDNQWSSENKVYNKVIRLIATV